MKTTQSLFNDSLNYVVGAVATSVALVPHTTQFNNLRYLSSADKYDVPKGTLAMVNYWALHNDPEQWHEPSEFRPERFLDAEGNLGPKPRSYYPFAGGRRVCLGEGLAKSTLMMVIPKLYQALKISSPLGDQFRIQLDTSSSLMSLPQPYDVIVEQRK